MAEKYSKLIEAGRLELVSAPLNYYPQYIFHHGKGTGQKCLAKVDDTFNRPVWLLSWPEGCIGTMVDQWIGLRSTFNDDNERMLWRTKQCLGNSLLHSYGIVVGQHAPGPYYMEHIL